jgi:hypothetical protein
MDSILNPASTRMAAIAGLVGAHAATCGLAAANPSMETL